MYIRRDMSTADNAPFKVNIIYDILTRSGLIFVLFIFFLLFFFFLSPTPNFLSKEEDMKIGRQES